MRAADFIGRGVGPTECASGLNGFVGGLSSTANFYVFFPRSPANVGE